MLNGNAEAFAELYDRRHGAIYRYVLRMTGSEATAEDVTHDVFLELMRDARNFDETRGQLQGYIFGMARHRVLRSLQTSRNFVSFEGESGEELMETNFISATDPFMDFRLGHSSFGARSVDRFRLSWAFEYASYVGRIPRLLSGLGHSPRVRSLFCCSSCWS